MDQLTITFITLSVVTLRIRRNSAALPDSSCWSSRRGQSAPRAQSAQIKRVVSSLARCGPAAASGATTGCDEARIGPTTAATTAWGRSGERANESRNGADLAPGCRDCDHRAYPFRHSAPLGLQAHLRCEGISRLRIVIGERGRMTVLIGEQFANEAQ